MQIYGPSAVHGPQHISAPHGVRGPAGAAPARSTADVSDSLSISDSARIASQLNDIPAIRQDRVNSIRAAIADGSYETDAKLSTALDRLLDEIA